MKRRNFIKLSLAVGAGILLPDFVFSEEIDFSKITFSSGVHSANNAQTIIVYLYGGASQLAGNLTNMTEIAAASESNYNYFGDMTATTNNFWKEAGGEHLEKLIADGDMTIFRTCYAYARGLGGSPHGSSTSENQRGNYGESAGILTNLAYILDKNGAVDQNTQLPFITLEGESTFYAEEETEKIPTYLKPAGFSADFSNPYSRNERATVYYSPAEDPEKDAILHTKMDALAQKNNPESKIKTAFSKRIELNTFIKSIRDSATPDLGDDAYPESSDFANTLEAAIKILIHSPETKVITTSGSSGLGGWDDHEHAREYIGRIDELYRVLRSAMAHIKAAGKEDTINIMVFGEFGRNVNLNITKGWDHGNLQNVYILGGKGYFNHKGVVGETVLQDESSNWVGRIFQIPKPDTYSFEPPSIAATLYKIYGIENPDVLTGGYGEITPLFS